MSPILVFVACSDPGELRLLLSNYLGVLVVLACCKTAIYNLGNHRSTFSVNPLVMFKQIHYPM